MLDVGAGVGYLTKALVPACRLDGRGKPGDDERGSNGGSSEGAGRLTPAVGSAGSKALPRVGGEESIGYRADALRSLQFVPIRVR